MSDGNNPPAPRGRGAFLYAALLEKQKKQQLEAAQAPEPADDALPARAVGRGRASIVDKILQQQASQASTSGTDAPPISKGVGRASANRLLQKLAETRISTPAEKTPSPTETKATPPPVEYQETEPVLKRAQPGKTDCTVPASANYIRLEVEPGKGVFEYEIRFTPSIDARNIKFKLLNQFLQGARTFDGTVLYLPEQLPDDITIHNAPHPVDEMNVEIKIIFKRKRRLGECIHLYNIMFRRIFKLLEYAQLGRQMFDPTRPHRIQQHKLEIWPGYVTAVDEYEGGVMLCIDCSHRVLRMDTVRSFLTGILQKDPRTFQQSATKGLVGTSVLTKYNNKLYKVDDILWDANPKSTFTSSTGVEVSYYDYYKKQYEIEITDMKQPLLVNRAKRRVPNSTEQVDQLICLIPELCYMTGLTDDMRNNFTLMKDVAMYTRVTPNQRVQALRKFVDNVRNCAEAQKLLGSWGLKLAGATIDLEMRIMAPESIYFGNAEVRGTNTADWSRAVTSNHVTSAIDLHTWYLLYTPQDKRNASAFAEQICQIGGPMGLRIARPKELCLPNDYNATYIEALTKVIQPNVQIVTIICPTSRDDRYSIIKKICCADKPIPSQLIMSRTLNNPKRVRRIIQMIALQMNCKLGGQLWSVKLPKHQWMICGIDTYHDAKSSGQSVAGFVASMNQQVTRWYSQVNYQLKGEELLNALKTLFTTALKQYFDVNGFWPANVIIYRDGVGDGQLKHCRDYEIEQLREAMKALRLNPENMPKLTFIVVQKRINTRLFAKRGEYENPPPGSVVDHTVTRRDWYDFFLVSQHVGQGTVSPTHYCVLKDESQLSIEQVQKLTFKMCHLYYNWSGTVRVPAPCQYAHKLAYLVGTNIRKVPSEKLADRLYYL